MTQEKFDPVYELDFTDIQTGKKVTARLGLPIFDGDKHRYYCLSELVGIEEGKRQRVYSDGLFETLTLALLRFRVLFSKQSGDLRTEMGSSPHMLFPKEIPWVYGSDVYQRLCKLVDDEVQKIEDERTNRRESRSREEE